MALDLIPVISQVGAVQITPPTSSNAVLVYLATLAPQSRPKRHSRLNQIAALLTGASDAVALEFPWQRVRYEHLAALRQLLAERYKAGTANHFLAAARGVLKACWRLKLMSAEDYHMACSVEAVEGHTLPAGREIPIGEIAALLGACARDPSLAGRRDAAVIALLYACGLRRAELSSLQLADWDGVNRSLRVQGKGNKERLAYVADAGAYDALLDWLGVRGEEPGPLFWSLRCGGPLVGRKPFPPQNIPAMLARRGAAAQVAKFSPHDFRRTFVGDLLDAGVDLVTVSKLAGHANVTTTARYDRRPEEAKRAASLRLHVPYRRMLE